MISVKSAEKPEPLHVLGGEPVICPLASVKPGNLASSQPNYPSCLPSNRIPPEGPPQFCILHFDLCIFRYKCRRSSTNRPFFVQTNPILSASGGFKSLYLTKTYDNIPSFPLPKTNPKQTQTKPKQTQFFARQGPPKPKRTQTNPISSPHLLLDALARFCPKKRHFVCKIRLCRSKNPHPEKIFPRSGFSGGVFALTRSENCSIIQASIPIMRLGCGLSRGFFCRVCTSAKGCLGL